MNRWGIIGQLKPGSDMSVQADQYSPSPILELPSTWIAHLIQHVASGTGGLASAAALSQTCKSLYALSESSAVTYLNIHVDSPMESLDHPFFRWLAKRRSRVAGLTAELRLRTVGGPGPEPEQLQVMFGIPRLHLSLLCDGEISTPNDPFITKVLRPHGHLIDHLSSLVYISEEGLTLQDFSKAAAPCRSVDLKVCDSREVPLNMGALDPVAGSLARLHLKDVSGLSRESQNVSSLSLLSQLTSLRLEHFEFRSEEPWIYLVGLTNLKQLSLRVAASGDPSLLSALTGLSFLELRSHAALGGVLTRYTLSSLQPLSTMQQLVQLVLESKSCSATSLQGLAELSSLKVLKLDAPILTSMEGVATGLTSLTLGHAPQLVSLAGIEHVEGLRELIVQTSPVSSLQPVAGFGKLEKLQIGGTFTSLAGLQGSLCTCLHSLRLESCSKLKLLSGIEGLTALQQLEVEGARVTSLQHVGQLVGGLKKLHVKYCLDVQEDVLELPHMQPTASIMIRRTKVKEVVLAGGVRRRVDARSGWVFD